MARSKQGVFSWEDVLVQRYQSNKPPPLPRSRRRTIASIQPQLQCRLLSRLSPELRVMVWEMVMGDRRLHIIQRSQQRLGHIVCPLGMSATSGKTRCQTRESFCEICHGGGIPQPVKEGDLMRGRDGDMLLGLPLACRQMYNESIHLLYTLNTFEFSNPWSLPYLRPTIPSEHWDCIRAVELRWSFPGHWLPSKDPVRAVYVSAGRAQWLETCRALSRIGTLQSFVLILGSSWFSEPVEKLPVFLEPLRGLRVQHSRRAGQVARVEQGPECSSDEESSTNTSVASSASTASSTRSCAYACTALPSPGPCASRPPALTKTDPRLASWELRLQGQPYYAHELGRMGAELRRKGIECRITTA